jgi:hypothetical protein
MIQRRFFGLESESAAESVGSIVAEQKTASRAAYEMTRESSAGE